MAAAGRPNALDRTPDLTSPSTETVPDFEHGHGHYFTKKTFHKPTYCHHCTDMLWGLIGQGYVCEGKLQLFFYFEII